MIPWPSETSVLLVLLLLSSTGGLTGAILTGWNAKTLCDADYCSCDAIKSRVSCSCRDGIRPKEILLQANGTNPLPSSTSVLRVENCFQVTVSENAISSLIALRHIEIQHVRHLIIKPHAFNWNHQPLGLPNGVETGLKMLLNNASLPELPSYTFEGRHTSIHLENLKITVIRAYSFANLDNGISLYHGGHEKAYMYPDTYYTERTIEIINCDIGTVESLAFRRFSAAEILWMGGRVGAFNPRALLDITLIGFDRDNRGGVTKAPGTRSGLGLKGGLRMENLYVGKIDSSAMYLSRISSLQFLNVSFIIFDAGAIRASVDSPVIRNSFFGKIGSGAFLAILPVNTFRPSSNTIFMFENNTISRFENASLLVHPSYQLRTDNIRIDRACLCSSLWRWTLTLIGQVNHGSEKDSSIVHSPHPPPQEATAIFPALQCRPEDGDKYVSFDKVEQQMCKNGLPIKNYIGTWTVIIVVLVCIGVVFLFTLLAHLWIRRKKRKNLDIQRPVNAWIRGPTKRQTISRSCTDEDMSMLSNGSSEPRGKEFMVVMPDLKTYRETELHVIIERAEPLSMEGNEPEYQEPKSQLLENEDYPDAEKTSL